MQSNKSDLPDLPPPLYSPTAGPSTSSTLVPISRSKPRNHSQTKALPAGYFQIATKAGDRVWDVTSDHKVEGSGIGLYSPKSLQSATISNQIFFLDWDGHLQSSLGLAIGVNPNFGLCLALPKPISSSGPTLDSHPLPNITLDSTGVLLVKFNYDPTFNNLSSLEVEQQEWAVEIIPQVALAGVGAGVLDGVVSGLEGISSRLFGKTTYVPAPIPSTSSYLSDPEDSDSDMSPYRDLRVIALPPNWREEARESRIWKRRQWKAISVLSYTQGSLLDFNSLSPTAISHGIRTTSPKPGLKPLRTADSATIASSSPSPTVLSPLPSLNTNSRWSTLLSFPANRTRSTSSTSTSSVVDRVPSPSLPNVPRKNNFSESEEDEFGLKATDDFIDAEPLSQVDTDLVTKLEEMNAAVREDLAKRSSIESLKSIKSKGIELVEEVKGAGEEVVDISTVQEVKVEKEEEEKEKEKEV